MVAVAALLALAGQAGCGSDTGDGADGQLQTPVATGPEVNAGSAAPPPVAEDPVASPGQQPPTSGMLPGPDQQNPPTTPTMPAEDVPVGNADDPFCGALSVFRTDCQGCHGSELVGGAPMPLVTWEDTQAPAVSDPSKPVHALIGTRIHDMARPMPPISLDPLTDPKVAAVDSWLAAGAPNAVGGACEGIVDEPTPTDDAEPEWPADCQERFEIRASDGQGNPYLVPANAELNVNIEIPVPWAGQGSGAVQALAIRPISNNKRVVHHWILYAGLGEFVTSWSPGKPFEVFDDNVGVHMPTEGNFRLNMHYFNVGNDQDELDDSGLEVCITRDLRENTATTHMFGSIQAATVPSGGRVDNQATCTVNATEPVHIITSSPHMHSYGVAAKMEIIRADGSIEVLEDGPFSWEDQHITKVDAVVNTGDQIRVTCSYNNDSGQTVTFGNSSADEMCFNFARYYPMDAFTCGGLGGFPGLGGEGGFPGF